MSILENLESLENDLICLRHVQNELKQKFKKADLSFLNNRITFLTNEKNKKQKVIENLELLYNKYILKIQAHIQKQKKSLCSNKHILEKYPDIFKSLVLKVQEKENHFLEILYSISAYLKVYKE